jgi:hypothetical protein
MKYVPTMKSTFGCQCLVTLLLALVPVNEASSLKTALHVRGSRAQWKTLDAAADSTPTSLISLREAHAMGKKDVSQSGSEDVNDHDNDNDEIKETADDVEKAAADEVEKDDEEMKAEGNETKQKKKAKTRIVGGGLNQPTRKQCSLQHLRRSLLSTCTTQPMQLRVTWSCEGAWRSIHRAPSQSST